MRTQMRNIITDGHVLEGPLTGSGARVRVNGIKAFRELGFESNRVRGWGLVSKNKHTSTTTHTHHTHTHTHTHYNLNQMTRML